MKSHPTNLVLIITKKSRLNRINSTSKQSKAYAEEKLIAEIGSVLLAAHFSINGDLFNHASYVASWKKYLTPKEIMRAVNMLLKLLSMSLSDMLFII